MPPCNGIKACLPPSYGAIWKTSRRFSLICVIEILLDSQPRVLGLTASLINNKTPPRLLETNLTKLEQALHCCIETASDLVEVSVTSLCMIVV